MYFYGGKWLYDGLSDSVQLPQILKSTKILKMAFGHFTEDNKQKAVFPWSAYNFGLSIPRIETQALGAQNYNYKMFGHPIFQWRPQYTKISIENI